MSNQTNGVTVNTPVEKRPSLVGRFVQWYLNAGVEDWQHPIERRVHYLNNIFATIYLVICIFMVGLCVYLYIAFIFGAGEQYALSPLFYWPWPAGMIVCLLLSQLAKHKKWTSLNTLITVNIIFGTVWICAYSLMLGRESLFHLYLLVLIPVPMFLTDFKRRALGRTLSAGILTVFLITYFVVYNVDALYPLPYDMVRFVGFIIVPIIAVSLGVGFYYFWGDYIKAEALLSVANENLEERDRQMRKELSFAAHIQQGIFPSSLVTWRNVSVTTSLYPLAQVSGDFYDVYPEDETFSLLLADISGHGIPAALITMVAKQIFSREMEQGARPAEIFRRANEELVRSIKTRDYLTAFMLQLTPDGRMVFCNGGHTRPVLHSKQDGTLTELAGGGILIGAIEKAGITYSDQETRLQAGDRIFLYTDGIVHQRNEAGDEYGVERFKEQIHNNASMSAADAHNKILTDFQSFRQGMPAEDDFSLLTLEFS